MGYRSLGDIAGDLRKISAEAMKIYTDAIERSSSEGWDLLKTAVFFEDSVRIMATLGLIHELAILFVMCGIFLPLIYTMESEKDKFELERRLSGCTKRIKDKIAELVKLLTQIGSQCRNLEHRDWVHRAVDCLEEIDDDCKKLELYE